MSSNEVNYSDEEEIIPVAAVDPACSIPKEEKEDIDEGVVHLVSDNTKDDIVRSQEIMINLDEQWRAALAQMNEEELSDDFDDEEEEEDLASASLVQDAAAADDDEDESSQCGMRLSQEELEWAKQIKEVIEDDPDLDNLSDFAYAQHALVEPSRGTPEGLEAVLERAHQMQALRTDKKILDSCSHAKRTIRETMKLFPGHLLALHYDEVNGGHVFVFDSTKLIASTFSSNPNAYDNWISTLYYIYHAANADFASMRQGLSLHVECEGFDFSKNFGIKIFSKVWTEGGTGYPTIYNVLRHYHTSMFKNLMVSMAKRFIPRDLHQKFQVGCVSEVGRLDKAYLQPNLEEANQRLEKRIMENLQRRYENEKSFSL